MSTNIAFKTFYHQVIRLVLVKLLLKHQVFKQQFLKWAKVYL